MQADKIGSIAWLRETGGRLTLKSRLSLLSKALAPNVVGIFKALFRSGANAQLSLDSVPMPDSAAIKHALDALENSASNSVFQHSFRTYLWGAGFGEIGKLKYDPELLLAGSLLHDLVMTERYRNDSSHCFTGDSAAAAISVMCGAGWEEERTEHLANIISLHMNPYVGPSDGHEAHLLQQGAACDIVGRRYYDFHSAYRQAVLQKHPRDGLNRVFTAFLDNERRTRPASRAALMHQIGLPLMIRMNPFPE